MKNFKFYEVGGKIRDEILGLTSTDLDYVVVADQFTSSSFFELQEQLTGDGYQIFVTIPERRTIRAKLKYNKQIIDFVLSEGTLEDDLARRDFTMNAIARNGAGQLIDPFNGQADIKYKVIECPIDPIITFNDDPVRIFRALRFAVVLDFRISFDTWVGIGAVQNFENLRIEKTVDELIKATTYLFNPNLLTI